MTKTNGSLKKKNSSGTTNTTQTRKQTEGNIGSDDIAQRAYSIYLSGQGGTELDHWLQAERELLGTQSAQM